MTLQNALNNYEPNSRFCKFGPWFSTLTEDDRASVIQAFDNPEIATRHIFKVLKSIGCPSAESSIRTHRLRECQNCERTNYGQHV